MFGAAGATESVVTDPRTLRARRWATSTPAATATTRYENVVAFVPVCSTADVPVVGCRPG